MSGICRCQLKNGTDVVWAIPLSGMGHVADEQPLPYLQHDGIELTPRFGGEECNQESNLTSLPVPYGYFASDWPMRQRLFNMPRRRINIYWRNIFKDLTKKDNIFLFIEQLKYHKTDFGFFGESPILIFRREFILKSSMIEVIDSVKFKIDLHFSELFLCPWAELSVKDKRHRCIIQVDLAANYSRSIASSTGAADWYAHRVLDARYKSGDQLTWTYKYIVE